ncbi:MAG TPA: hypothetical protein VLS25_02220 [Dehalococcoidia bacterium]|nr:hypothetical protein [Dehalococcoidia bacterium]
MTEPPIRYVQNDNRMNPTLWARLSRQLLPRWLVTLAMTAAILSFGGARWPEQATASPIGWVRLGPASGSVSKPTTGSGTGTIETTWDYDLRWDVTAPLHEGLLGYSTADLSGSIFYSEYVTWTDPLLTGGATCYIRNTWEWTGTFTSPPSDDPHWNFIGVTMTETPGVYYVQAWGSIRGVVSHTRDSQVSANNDDANVQCRPGVIAGIDDFTVILGFKVTTPLNPIAITVRRPLSIDEWSAGPGRTPLTAQSRQEASDGADPLSPVVEVSVEASAGPGPDRMQGDVDCSGSVNSVDALKELRHVAQLSVTKAESCPDIGAEVASLWGDVDCSGDVSAVDALKILRHVAGLSVVQDEPCPKIGDPVG